MALAVFYGHKDVAAFFFQPVPKNRLMLNMARAVSTSAITVTLCPIVAEPVVTSALVHCILRPDGFRKSSMSRASHGGQLGKDTRPANDPFVLATKLICERVLLEEEWLKGKSIQISGLDANTGYLVRLVAINDAGTTHGEIVEVITKATKDSGRKGRTGSKDSCLNFDKTASEAVRDADGNTEIAAQVLGDLVSARFAAMS